MFFERTEENPAASDRELRDELEQVQAETSRLRHALASYDTSQAERALEASLAQAQARRQAAATALATLENEHRALEKACKSLDAQLEARREEDRIIGFGSTRRDEVVEWWSHNLREPPSPDAERILSIAFLLSLAIFLFLVIANSPRRPW